MDSASEGPRVGGLAHALWSLALPSRFEAREPVAMEAYAVSRRRGVAPLYDVYLPDGPGPHPSVILVHGGGFVLGSRRMKPVRLLATRLADAGFASCAIDYRLLFRGGALAAQVADVDTAATFWRSRCEAFGCDPERISMAGFSAGAALMLLHAGRTEAPYHRLVSIYGATEFDRMGGRRAGLLLRLVLETNDRRAWRERSPAAFAHHPAPLLVMHGTADRLVPVAQAERLYARRNARGLPTDLELVERMPHGWLNDAALPETEQAIERVISFLR